MTFVEEHANLLNKCASRRGVQYRSLLERFEVGKRRPNWLHESMEKTFTNSIQLVLLSCLTRKRLRKRKKTRYLELGGVESGVKSGAESGEEDHFEALKVMSLYSKTRDEQ